MSTKEILQIAQRMAEEVDKFDGSETSLADLSFSLKANLALLHHARADEDWIDELRTLRNDVEVINAFFVESGRQNLTERERIELAETLEELRAALIQY